MKFMDLIIKEKDNVDCSTANIKINEKVITEEAEKPEEILRRAGVKIKLITPTSFGTQIDFAKKYEDDDIKDMLKGFNIKIKNKSVFIVD